jgi:hypothetical protein
MIYSQSTGKLFNDDGSYVDTGHSGHGVGLNNPAMQNVKNIGPLPQGWYTIGAPITDKITGPYSLPLTPDPANEMYNRGSFLMHGGLSEPFTEPDGEVINPGQESDGCPIFSRVTREKVWNGPDHRLQVVE